MKKPSHYAKYRLKEKHRKQYTFTKTKFVVGFLVSVLSSVFLGAYFDRYGQTVIDQTVAAFSATNSGSQLPGPPEKKKNGP